VTADLIKQRQWLPKGWPLLKHIWAVTGDTYCVKSLAGKSYSLYIINQYTGPVAEKDSQGLPLTHIKGCHVVGKDNFLPVSTYINNSFDGRYYGEISLSSIRGIAEPVVTF
jgi:type IV secretory pathway protease TraF